MIRQESLIFNAMAPLLIGDPSQMNSADSQTAWEKFARQLVEIKQLGIQAVSSDVWWGIIEADREGEFDWSYYDKLSNLIVGAGLKWVPILSFHKCGGNIGDDCTVNLPSWVFPKLAGLLKSTDSAGKYVSEQGNVSSEYVSVWATDLILENYRSVMSAFQNRYAYLAPAIAEINLSLGPAGELRYPSYNSHDKNSDYPHRGSVQAYSKLARQSFHDYIMQKYGNLESLNKAWGHPLDRGAHVIEPPRDVEQFFRNQGQHKSQYGRDFCNWYAQSLREHGRKVMQAAISVFGSKDSAFAGIDLAAKVPGVHWRMGAWKGEELQFADRLAEIPAGLISANPDDWNEFRGRGYAELISLFSNLAESSKKSRIVLHFTCLEMPDAAGNPGVNSLAYTLVRWIGKQAKRAGLTIKGENALAFHLYDKACWDRMRSHLALQGNNGDYAGITFLRLTDILASRTAQEELKRLIAQSGNIPEAA